MEQKNFVRMFEDSFRQHWALEAYSDYDYKGIRKTYTYAQIAELVEKLHIAFEVAGIQKNDKVSLIGRNSSNWCVAYVATITYGAVIVPILPDFHADDMHHIVRHSDSKFLFVADQIWSHLDESELGGVRAVLSLTDFAPLTICQNVLAEGETLTADDLSLNVIQSRFNEKFKNKFNPDSISYYYKDNEEVTSINYTSGTTGFSKGVMTTGRALASNAEYGMTAPSTKYGKLLFPGDRMVTFLPLAHAYGCAFDFLGNTCAGGHTYFITGVPTPKVLLKAFAEIKPTLILSVPMIIEKIYRKQIVPQIAKPPVSWVLKVPLLDNVVLNKVRQSLVSAFGGCFEEIIIGGAAFNAEVEAFLRKIKFPYSVGYGMTETAPLISYRLWNEYVPTSCGQILECMEVRIDNPNAEGIGEIVVRGDNVMLGYYKNEQATADSFTEDGWLRTGDLGTVDAEGNIFIKGRCKTMLLSANGQNIYPEELEDKLNNMPYVAESIVVQRDNALVALIYPDVDACDAAHFTDEDIKKQLEKIRVEVNAQLGSYCQIAAVERQMTEFAKTPKNSIKRYLYK